MHRFDCSGAPQSAEGLVHGAEGPLLVNAEHSGIAAVLASVLRLLPVPLEVRQAHSEDRVP